MFKPLQIETDDLNVYLSLDQILKYFDGCLKCNIIDDQAIKFMPYARVLAMKSNKHYDPDNFSKELEDKYKCKLNGRIPNTEEDIKLYANHKKGFAIELALGPILSLGYTSNGEREFVTDINRQAIINWFNDLTANGEHVYMFQL